MKNQADSTRDLLYDLIMRNIEMYMKYPGSQDVHPLISTLSDTFIKLVEIDDSPKGKQLKQKIIELLVPDEHVFKMLRSLATVENISEVAFHIKEKWLSNEFSPYRIEAVNFLSICAYNPAFLADLLKNEKDSLVQSAIVTELARLENPDALIPVFDFVRKVDNDEIRLLAIQYFEKVANKDAFSFLVEITEDLEGLFSSQTLREAAYEAMKRISYSLLNKND